MSIAEEVGRRIPRKTKGNGIRCELKSRRVELLSIPGIVSCLHIVLTKAKNSVCIENIGALPGTLLMLPEGREC